MPGLTPQEASRTMPDPLARLHARRRLSRLLRQRLRTATAPYADLPADEAGEESARARAQKRRARIARARAELDSAVAAPQEPVSPDPGNREKALQAKAIAHLLRRAMDPKGDDAS